MWKYYALLSALFAGMTAILAKTGVKGISGNIATAVRTGVVLLLAWGIVIFQGQLKDVAGLNKTNVLFLILSGMATGLSWIFYFKALETGNVSKVAPIDKLSIVFVLFFSVLFLHEQADWKTIVGIIFICGGTIVLLL
ncbi:MAG: EamA family transporter [Planctomycetaceae bacterium]|jgi:transporter family protein|nr:EamA family transporter [Planctomycetaceae bacterium]